MPRKKHIDPIPDEFASYEDAAAFWDTHDTADYPDSFRTVPVVAELRRRHYEVEIDQDVAKVLFERARRKRMTASRLASDLLRRQLAAK